LGKQLDAVAAIRPSRVRGVCQIESWDRSRPRSFPLPRALRSRSSRLGSKDAEHSLFSDRLERRGAEFQRLVRQGFLAQARDQPEKYLVVDGSGDADAVFALLLRGLQERLG
jgi:hypothetical protein